MLDLTMYGALHGRTLGTVARRCRFCEQGPVINGDGFQMNRCMSCGGWQHYDYSGASIKKLSSRLGSFFKSVSTGLKIRLRKTQNGLKPEIGTQTI